MRTLKMISFTPSLLFGTLLIFACACGGPGSGGSGGPHPVTYSFSVLHSFTGKPDGGRPYAGLVRDTVGNLYGTTTSGGIFDGGTVFKLDPSGNETVLYNFTGGADGWYPAEGELTLDTAGNIYGTAAGGGSTGFGLVFRLDVTGTETVLYNFTAGVDGGSPHAGVVRDGAGNLYGTAETGGDPSCGGFGCGVAFAGPDGAAPAAALVQDSNGNLYGTTEGGGANSEGTAFKIDSAGNEGVLYSFTGKLDGTAPISSLALDQTGNLYGTTDSGGNSPNCFFGCGVVFILDPTGKQTVLHNFDGTNGAQGLGLVVDSQGNLYGTTSVGGASSCDGFTSECGLAFKLTRMP